MIYSPATLPTFYFIGVTTSQSSIMKVFPAWAEYLGLGDVEIKGIDFPAHDKPENYREAVNFLKNDPLSFGALITTHKLNLFQACKDMFDVIDPHATLMAETSCISKRDGQLICHAKDPISSGLSLDGFLPENHFAKTDAELFSMGAGGSTIALTWHLMQEIRGDNRPKGIVVSDRSKSRLIHIREIHESLGSDIPVEYRLVKTAQDNDEILASMAAGSVVINATGLGKDSPGSPLSDVANFPKNAIIWDLNYRGDLVFLDQAKAAKAAKGLQIEDGWTYFLHGWTQVIAEVFSIEIPVAGERFEAVSRIAIEVTGR